MENFGIDSVEDLLELLQQLIRKDPSYAKRPIIQKELQILGNGALFFA